MLLRLGQPCVFSQSCLCDRTGDDVALGLFCNHLQGILTWLCCVDHASFCAPAAKIHRPHCNSTGFTTGAFLAVKEWVCCTSVIWKQTWWIHVCVFYGDFLSGRCVSVIYLVCLGSAECCGILRCLLGAHKRTSDPSLWTPSETCVWSLGWVYCVLIPWACQPKYECKYVIPLELYSIY